MSSLNSRAGWKYGNGVGVGTSGDLARSQIKGLQVHGEYGKRVSVMNSVMLLLFPSVICVTDISFRSAKRYTLTSRATK